MLWGERQIGQWTGMMDRPMSMSTRTFTHALAFNEPELSGQSNLTVQQGVELWKTYMQPLKAQGVQLGSPASSSAPSGKTWLRDFLSTCGGNCTVDFVALHWYGINSTQFIQYLQDFHNTFQRPIWVTEWACQNYVNVSKQCSQQDVVNFMNVTQSFMDGAEWVERYSWFGAMKDMQGVNEYNSLMGTNGTINELGRQYIGEIGQPTSKKSSGGGFSVSLAKFVLPPIFCPLVVALFVVLLI